MKRSTSSRSLNNKNGGSRSRNSSISHPKKSSLPIVRASLLSSIQQEQQVDCNGKLTTSRSSLDVAACSSFGTNYRAIGTDIGSQVRVLDTGVKLCARKLNEAKAHAEKIDEELCKKLDELKDLHSERVALDNMLNGNNGEARRIEELSKQIEEINVASEEQLHYRLRLNHVEDRSKKKSLVMDGEVLTLSDSVDASERELSKFERALGEVQSSHAKALRDLGNTIREVELERQQRNTELSKLRCEADNAELMKAWRLERQGSRAAAIEEPFRGSNNHDKEKKARSVRERRAEAAQLRADLQTKITLSSDLEESFKKMKEATGANSLAEMLAKFTQLKEQRDRLLTGKKDAEERLAGVRISLEKARARFNEAKESGVGETEVNHDVINHLNECIALEKVESKVASSLNERMEGVLVGLRQGVTGLYHRLLPFHATFLEGEAPQLSGRDTTSAMQAAYDTMEMLEVSEKIVDKMLGEIGGVECVSTTVSLVKYQASQSSNNRGRVHGSIDETLENPNLGENNCRIQPKESSPIALSNTTKNDNDDSSNDNMVGNINNICDPGNHLVLSRSYFKQESQKFHNDRKTPQYTVPIGRLMSEFSNYDEDTSK